MTIENVIALLKRMGRDPETGEYEKREPMNFPCVFCGSTPRWIGTDLCRKCAKKRGEA